MKRKTDAVGLAPKRVNTRRALQSLVYYEEDFLELLAKELMLDELLCGEAEPKEFLIESIERVLNKQQVKYHTKRLEELGETE